MKYIFILLFSIIFFKSYSQDTIKIPNHLNRDDIAGYTFVGLGITSLYASSYSLFNFPIGNTLFFGYMSGVFFLSGTIIIFDYKSHNKSKSVSIRPNGVILNF